MCHKIIFFFFAKNLLKSRMLFLAVNIIVVGFDLVGRFCWFVSGIPFFYRVGDSILRRN